MCITPKMGILRPPEPLSVRNAGEEARYYAVLRSSNQRAEALQLQREREFKRNQPEYALVMKLERVRCPLHVNRFKKSLKQLPPGQTLKLQSKSKALVKDLEAACRIMGIGVKILRVRRQYFLYATSHAVSQAEIYSFQHTLAPVDIADPTNVNQSAVCHAG